jgi:hypothetical protein
MQNSNDYEDFIKLDLHYYYTLDPHENYNALKALSHHRSAWLLEGLFRIMKILHTNKAN